MTRVARTSGIALFMVLLASGALRAQDSGQSDSFLNTGLLVIGALVVLGAIIILAENLLKVEAKRNNLDTSRQDTSIFPGISNLFKARPPGYIPDGEPFHELKKGHDLRLFGEPKADRIVEIHTSTYAMQPPNFRGIAPIPKVNVEEGDEVKAGDPIFYNKLTPDIKYVAPVSGEIAAINRGAKRAITEVVILADREIKYRRLDPVDPDTASREDLVAFLMDAGFWPFIIKRPFDVVADGEVVPRDIFISTFDSSPLAADLNVMVNGREEAFQKGLDVLGKLTAGKVYLGLNANEGAKPSGAFSGAKGVEKHWFKGPHPAGNVGVQMHHIKPILPGDTVWTLQVPDVIMLGKLFTEGKFEAERLIALSGEFFRENHYIRTRLGAKVGDLVDGVLTRDPAEVRLISGNVLTGRTKTTEQYVNAFDTELSVIEEGDYYEMFGWLLPTKSRPSLSRTFPYWLFPDTEYKVDTNMHGEQRAFVMTSDYPPVMPMDIYPQHLFKAILTNNFEKMEGLGIYELSEEDVALCEFRCTSKMPLQKILREGLDTIREQV